MNITHIAIIVDRQWRHDGAVSGGLLGRESRWPRQRMTSGRGSTPRVRRGAWPPTRQPGTSRGGAAAGNRRTLCLCHSIMVVVERQQLTELIRFAVSSEEEPQ